MKLILSKDCTRSLDVAIAEERVRYASERLDFHDFLWDMTVPQLQRIIRGEAPPPDDEQTRQDVINDLFEAQQESPHRLGELLILQAVEPMLVKRRRALLPDDDPHLDEIVVSTFLAALEYIPMSVWYEDAQAYVLRVSRVALARKVRQGERVARKRRAANRAATVREARAVSTEAGPVVPAKPEVSR